MSHLHMTVSGRGRPLVALHGWGMNSRIWQSIQPELEQQVETRCIDLPGHGQNHHLTLGSLEHVTEQLAEYIPNDAIIMGWSLGGLIALALAHALPKRVAGLILVASTPKFVADESWEYAIAPEVLTSFAQNLQTDYAATVKRFFALQFLGVKTDTQQVARLRDRILEQPANLHALEDGLNLLRTADFSQNPAAVPTLWLLGKLDKLIPVSLAEGLATLGYTQIQVLPHAAHVPFVTHPELFMAHVRAFLDNMDT